MSFNLPYQFQVSGKIVVIQHAHNGHIRISPNNQSRADGGGGNGDFARWRIVLEGGHFCRLQSTKTSKYFRLFRSGNEIDVDGGTGPFTKFKIHYHSRPNGIKLESDRFPGRYIAVTPNRTMKIGTGGPHCKLWVNRQGAKQVHHVHKPQHHHHHQQVKVVQSSVGQGAFKAPYLFQQNNTVIITSNHGRNLRVSPNDSMNGDGNGGTGNLAKWRVILDGNRVIKLQNTHNGKYLRIQRNNVVNVGGGGGQMTRFRYHVHRHPNGVKLESVAIPGKYIAIHPNGTLTHGTGGIHTQLTFWRQGGGAQQANFISKPVQSQQANFIVAKPQQAQGAFNAQYQFQQNNTVVVRSNYNKHLRVSPNNTFSADGNGGTGQFARWKVILDGNRVIKLQSTQSGKYLRIEGNAVNVGGGGGALTRFRYHVHRHPHGVKLESCSYPGKYVAIHPNGTVTIGTGGIHTQLTFWRQGANVKQVIVQQQQPQVIIQRQPQVIVQRQPQVIVQQPAVNSQQMLMEQQMLAQQQQIAAQQQQMEQQMASQQAQMQQQMEQMQIQKEIEMQRELEAQRQQMQLEEARQKQLMEQQAMMASNHTIQQEGVPIVNPYYGNVASNTTPSYPVLNQPVSNPLVVEQKAPPDTAPVEAANEAIFVWLSKLKMERYYTTFIQNGYDKLGSVGEITKEDLKEMGVALGHIKTIVAASITAPFLNRKLRVKCLRYETYLNEHDVKKHDDGLRCILQHSENKMKAGSVWLFEILDNNLFRLKHVETGTWLRIMKEDGSIDTRSPFNEWSKMILEKQEKAKGVYFIKESRKENYVQFDEPRTFGYNQVGATQKRDGSCRVALEVIKD